MINNHKDPSGNDSYGEWEIHLTMQISFISSLDTGKIPTMDSKSKNIEILMGNETDDIISELFESFKQTYQEGLEGEMEKSEFIFESVDLLYYNLHKTRLRRGKSYIKFPEWLTNKRATINPENKKDGKCFQYVVTVALNHQNIEKHPEKISKIKPHINKYNWKGIEFPSHQEGWKKFEQNNKTIALNILFVTHNTKTISLACKSKYNHKHENKVVLLMITDGEK